MNTPLDGGAAYDTNDSEIRDSTSVPPFSVANYRVVEYGSKLAEFTVILPGVEVESELFIPETSPAFVVPASVRSKYDGRWVRRAKFSQPLADAVLAHIARKYTSGGRERS